MAQNTSATGLPAERWATIPEFPKYEASTLGRIRYTATGRVRKQSEQRGRFAVTLSYGESDGNTRRKLTTRNVGVLVLMAFVGSRPERAECSHLNGDYRDNRPENLVWETRRENLARKVGHGTNIGPRGERNRDAKLTTEQVLTIRARIEAGERNCDLADEYGVDRTTVSHIKRRAKWAHLS